MSTSSSGSLSITAAATERRGSGWSKSCDTQKTTTQIPLSYLALFQWPLLTGHIPEKKNVCEALPTGSMTSYMYLSCRGNDRCTVLVFDAVVKAFKEKVGHAQQSMLLQVIKWIRAERFVLQINNKHTCTCS